MSTCRLRYGVPALFLLLSVVCLSSSRPLNRLREPIDGGETFSLEGSVVPVVERGLVRQQGRVHGGQKMPRMSLHFAMTADQNSDLDQLLTALQDRRSGQYHKFLTPEEYAARFGIRPADLAHVKNWLEQSGFTDLQVARGGMWISFSGTAAQAEAAFHVSLQHYSLNGETHFANAENPQLPKALQGLVASVRGLHNFAMKSQVKQIQPQYTSSFSGAHFLVPDDWATIYDLQPLYGAGLDGTGITIAIAGQSDVLLTDLRAFRTAAGLPAKDPTIVIPTGSTDPGTPSNDETESDLDLEWSGGIARNANILFVTANAKTGNGVHDSIAYVVDNNSAPILSISYGLCEADEPADYITSEDNVFKQASAQGITVLVSSGDAGATTCDQGVTTESAAKYGLTVAYPASSQYVTAVGGTTLESYGTYFGATNNTYGGSALSYIPESVWNDGFQASGGGGASKIFPKPAWQTGNGVPNDNARDLPDIAFAASPQLNGYLICSKGSCTNGFRNSSNYLEVIGGTSASAPSFAGLLALVMQKGGGNRLGNINANLYSLAQISTNAFHDIIYGNNDQACQTGTPDCPNGGSIGYSAGTGYDQATGLGSVDGYNFAQQWFGDFTLSSSTQSLTIQPGSSGTATVSVVPQNNFSGPVTFSCSVAGALIDVTCSVPATAVSGAGGSATVTITAATTAHTPWWRHLPSLPPLGIVWMLAATAILLAACSRISLRVMWGRRFSLPGFCQMLLFAIALGAVSCGGGGSNGSSSAGSSAPASALVLTCNLPNATVGLAYSGSCSASGGTAPYNYSVGSGLLPTGLTLNTVSGVITGTPTTSANYSLSFKVTDSENPVQSAVLASQTLTVESSALSLSCQLPAASTGVAYNGRCSAVGGTAPFHYSVSGAFPQALALNASTGVISGTPIIPTTASFVIMVIDSSPVQQGATYSADNFVVSAGQLVISCSLPGGTTGTVYYGSCTGSGGTLPFTYSVSAGSLPSGLGLFPNGIIGGAPLASGTNSFTVEAVDAGVPAQVVQLNQNISVVSGPLTLSCFFNNAKVNWPVNGGCAPNGGNPPFKYSVISGALPAGVTLNSSTGALAGVTTTVGTSSFTIQVTDSSAPSKTATAALTDVVVQPTTTLTVTCPSQQPAAALASPYSGSCPSTGGNYPYTVSVTSGTLPPGIFVNGAELDASSSGFVSFFGTPTQMGTYPVTIKVTDGSVPAQTATAQTTITVGPRANESGLVTITATSGGITNTTTIAVTVP